MSLLVVVLLPSPFGRTDERAKLTRAANPRLSQKESVKTFFDVRAFGAKGDGSTLDTPAINKAIDAAAATGGGTVIFPAGTYLSVSIHLQSNITLQIDHGATILAADMVPGKVTYDLPEPDEWLSCFACSYVCTRKCF